MYEGQSPNWGSVARGRAPYNGLSRQHRAALEGLVAEAATGGPKAMRLAR